ncbi:ABC transporter ATP-binding protein [Actinoalloteichus sp. GBA129-24]|uniref:ABC transporter ATP-binding protein n=1 Tax=Actinoalloteichus sp. GBA129-24 TaxID=1612551 RepID=UPI000950A7D3|nr:ABC transporter ATP-binding protein [Actinoalloteichus sp. GBA129-24]APU20081.1 ABC-type multidrug transport system, ATPase and permease component [Actinoalloteichus sp. GBA129-24]
MSTAAADRNTAASKKPMDFAGSARRLIGSMRPDLVLIIVILVLAAVSVALSVVVPALLGRVTDLVVTGLAGSGVDFTAIGRVLLVAIAIVVASAGFTLIRGRLTARIALSTAYRMREQAATKLTRLPLGYFDQQPRGEVLSRITNDVDNISQTLQQALNRIVTSVLTLIGVLVMMFWISPVLTLVALISVPLSILVTMAIGKRAQPQFVRQWTATGKLNGHIEEMYTGHALVQAFGRQQQAADTFEKHNQALFASSFRAQFVSGVIEPALRFIGNLGYVLIAVIGGLRIISGSMTIGDVQAFIQYSQQFNQPISQIASMANLLQSGVASAERVFALLDAEEQERDPATAPRADRVTGRVAFEEVSFRYQEDTPLIEDLSLAVEPGQTVAIVGPTGAGKTTLINLLMRFYEVTGGRITVDGVDIATMSRAELRRPIGMVLQDTWLVGGTIAENIAYGVDGATREKVVEAAMATHVDRFVRTLPEGYDTVMDHEGEGVSAGEKQLITIARAFLTEPAILILDEATSSVDTRTEVLIQHAMASLREGRTSFVIAHRLSTIRDADVILVMESGRIVEQGDHVALLASGGAYARLYAAQFTDATVETA